MAVSEGVRYKVKARTNGACYLFHKTPHYDDCEIVHWHHQGMGGRSLESEANQSENLLWACRECHERLHGPGVPWRIERYDPDAGVLEIIDPGGHVVDHADIFFHHRERWAEAIRRYAELSAALGQGRGACSLADVHLAWFKANGDAWRVVEEARTWEDFVGMLGLSIRRAQAHIRRGKWVGEQGIETLAHGIEADVIDALRKMKDVAEMARLLGIARDGKPGEIWEEIDQMKSGPRARKWAAVKGDVRPFEAQTKEEALAALEAGEVLVRGSLVTSGRGVKDE